MIYSTLLRPLLFKFDPEFVHRRTLQLGRILTRHPVARHLLGWIYDDQSVQLAVRVIGLNFRNPVGLAAGFDKGAELPPLMAALGFGYLEVGSISWKAWRGNPSPTLLRLPEDHSLINRLGLNSEGTRTVYSRILNLDRQIPLGINLVKTADPEIGGEEAVQDYEKSFRRFYPLADFITLNLSCPNTMEGRTFEDPELLDPFLSKIQRLRDRQLLRQSRRPVLLKLSPDLSAAELETIVKLAWKYGVDGFVVGNTTTRRDGLQTPAQDLEEFGFGGVSGLPLKRYIQQMVGRLYEMTRGQLPIIAVGGIGCDPAVHPAEEVWEYFNLGASLVQVYTGLIYRGPSLVTTIVRGLAEILERHHIPTLAGFLEERDQAAGRLSPPEPLGDGG